MLNSFKKVDTVYECDKQMLYFFQDNLQKFIPSLGGQMNGQIINLGGHFLSKDSGKLHFVGLHPGGGAPVPPPKPGSKGAGGGAGAGGAGGAGGLAGGDHGQGGKGDGGSASSSLKGWYNFWTI